MTSGLPDYTRNVSISAITIISLPVDIVAQSIGDITIDIAAQSMGNVAVNIAASAVTLDVNIASQAADIDVNIAASAVTLDVNIASQAANIDIDIAAQSVGNLSMNIAAAAIELDIKTLGGTNIIIDKLTQGAYTAVVTTLSNHSAPELWQGGYTGNNRVAKFFPRGARGFIRSISIHCKDVGAAGGTIYVSLAPYVGAGVVMSSTITVEAGGDEEWRYANIYRMWEYDSLFIFWYVSVGDIEFGYDIEDQDGFYSTDAGATWDRHSRRYWARAAVFGQTVGDLPVSGTVNTIQIPNYSVAGGAISKTIPNDTITTLETVSGMGKLIRCVFETSNSFVNLYIDIDGDTAPFRVFGQSPESMNSRGFNDDTPMVQVLVYAAEEWSVMQVTIPFEFRQKITFKAYHNRGGNEDVVFYHDVLKLV